MEKCTNFEKIITYKALGYLYKNDFLIDHFLSSDHQIEEIKIKNVCAPISLELIAKLEKTLSFLNMSKREFFEVAIIEALDKANVILNECGVLKKHEEELASMGF